MDHISELNLIKNDQEFWSKLIMTDTAKIGNLEVTWLGCSRIDRDDHYIVQVDNKYYAVPYDESCSYETVILGDFYEVDFIEKPVVVQEWFKK